MSIEELASKKTHVLKIGLNVQIMVTVLGSIVNIIRGPYDHLTSMRKL